MAQARRERSNAQVTVSIPWDLYRAIDRHREGTKLTRSKLVETAVREYLANADSAEKERRDGLGEKIEEVLELVKYQADRISEEVSEELSKSTERQVGILMRDRRATERVYALLESWVPEEYQQQAYEGANEAAGKRLKKEAERDRQRRAAEAGASHSGGGGDA